MEGSLSKWYFYSFQSQIPRIRPIYTSCSKTLKVGKLKLAAQSEDISDTIIYLLFAGPHALAEESMQRWCSHTGNKGGARTATPTYLLCAGLHALAGTP